ncbi:MAG: response regulator transcription factor [Chloroflexi bacterium]|jgi:two-component system response regulator DegU|nr:response regulator transcription factor [Chloroflexota bacterium]
MSNQEKVQRNRGNDAVSQPVRVMIVDDHPVIRSGVRQILAGAPDISVVAEAEDGAEALEKTLQFQPDILILDIRLPVMDGVQVVRELKRARSPAKVLVLSAYDDPGYVKGLFGMGIAGFLLKEEMPETLLSAVRGIAAGQIGWVSRRIALKISTLFNEEKIIPRTLTRREIQVLREVVAGKSNSKVASTLHISEKTVEKHLMMVMKKLGVETRVEAAVLAIREGWMD